MWRFTDFWCTASTVLSSDRRWILIYCSDQYLGLYAEVPPVYKRQCWCSSLCLGVCPRLQGIWEMLIAQFAETAPFSEVVDVNLPFFLDSGEAGSWTCPDLLVTPMAVYVFVHHFFISVWGLWSQLNIQLVCNQAVYTDRKKCAGKDNF